MKDEIKRGAKEEMRKQRRDKGITLITLAISRKCVRYEERA